MGFIGGIGPICRWEMSLKYCPRFVFLIEGNRRDGRAKTWSVISRPARVTQQETDFAVSRCWSILWAARHCRSLSAITKYDELCKLFLLLGPNGRKEMINLAVADGCRCMMMWLNQHPTVVWVNDRMPPIRLVRRKFSIEIQCCLNSQNVWQ